MVAFNVSESWGIVSLEHVVVTLSLAIESSEVFNLTNYHAALDDESIDIYKWLEDEHARRGDIEIELTSPSNTKSILLPYRKHDFINDVGYDSWPFMSVHFWGENPSGLWRLKTTYQSFSGSVFVWNISLTMFGVSDLPHDTNQGSCDMCSRGCDEVLCDVCPHLRNNISLTCVSVCPNTTSEYGGYCIEGDVIFPPSSESNSANISVIIAVSVVALVTLVTIATIFVVFVLIKRKKRKRLSNININYARLELKDDV